MIYTVSVVEKAYRTVLVDVEAESEEAALDYYSENGSEGQVTREGDWDVYEVVDYSIA